MRIQLLILVFLGTTQLELKSQDYVPFPTDSASWKEANEHVGLGFNAWLPVEYKMGGDTLISDLSYKKIFLTFGYHPNLEDGEYYLGGLREDNNKKIYFRPDSLIIDANFDYNTPLRFPSDTTEYLIYDFSQIQIGDTLRYEGAFESTFNPEYENVVLDIDSILVGSTFRKVYEVSDSHSWMGSSSFIVEGIGSSMGLFSPYSSPFLEFSNYQLACFTHNDIFFENPYELEVLDCQVGLSISEFSSSEVSIYPNPTTNNLFIESSGSPIQSVQIYSQSGKLVYSDSNLHGRSIELDLSKLDSGVYFVQIIDSSGSFTEKLVKE